jgi:beta-barrel assembly-enhancing protease
MQNALSVRGPAHWGRRAALAAVLASGMLAVPADVQAQAQPQAPKQPKPGFNIFSREQELEIGQQSAAQVERQMPILRDSNVEGFVDRIIDRMKAYAPGEKYPYQIKVVNASDINAFALPAGYMYVNRGLIQAARTESELAGVLAHEMAHVALRHGTHQASKATATQAGVGVLGGLLGLGRGGGVGGQVANVVGGLGLNALFLKFSRDAEYEADLVGAQIMHRAGYDPAGMSSFFELLQQMKGKNPGAVEQFFSSHPAPANRAQRIRAESQRLGPVRNAQVGGLPQVQAALRSMGAAPTMAQIQRGQVPSGSGGRTTQGRVQTGRVEAPSGRYRQFEHREGFFNLQYPDNWRVYEGQGLGVTIAPEGGVVEGSDGNAVIVYGVIVNHYDPFEQTQNQRRGATNLTMALDDIVAQVRRSNPHLRQSGQQRRGTIDNAPGLQRVLSGNSPVTGMEERVTVFARELDDGHIIYTLFIAPGRDYNTLSPTFERMIGTLQVNDSVAHR